MNGRKGQVETVSRGIIFSYFFVAMKFLKCFFGSPREERRGNFGVLDHFPTV